ncbi:hypothetical protein [Colwellia sp. E2M01]|uniref:hypothetical protein n=1 Tax=Colwellia sp. E2M01 TaxID=2841561 RepID=UPI001C0A5D5D|nr:hypothetical protein [Colwellia sp. E2M01]MBU2871872.1 hypothetical protein [Colwellia sp. E2M01]
MSVYLNKTVMILLLSLIFFGQSTASMIMSYNMTSNAINIHNMAKQSVVDNLNNNPSCHQTKTLAPPANLNSTSTNSNTANISIKHVPSNCCTQECNCLTTGCATVATFIASINHTPKFTTPTKIHSFKSLVSKNIPTSLYKPPILS